MSNHKNCVTHSHACDCREYIFRQKEKALEVAIRDLNSIKVISEDKCANLAEACLKDIETILRGDDESK